MKNTDESKIFNVKINSNSWEEIILLIPIFVFIFSPQNSESATHSILFSNGHVKNPFLLLPSLLSKG